MSAFKNMDYKNYTNNDHFSFDEINKAVDFLTVAFDAGAEQVLSDDKADNKIQNIVDLGATLFHGMSGAKGPARLNAKDTTALMLTFTTIAAKLDKNIAADTFVTQVAKDANQLFAAAVEKKIFQDVTTGLL
jgi:hypothetical protein